MKRLKKTALSALGASMAVALAAGLWAPGGEANAGPFGMDVVARELAAKALVASPGSTSPNELSGAGSASTPGLLVSGAAFTAGSGSTNWPQLLVQPTGTTSSAWSASGTYLGVNAPTGFGGDLLNLQTNGVFRFRVDSAGDLIIASTDSITFGSRGVLSSPAAGQIQLGAVDAAAPVAQTIMPQSVVAGTTNTAGQNLTIAGSKGTGTGAGGSILLQTAPAGSTGSAQNAEVTAITVPSTGVPQFNVIFTVSGLPTCTAGLKGSRTQVSDATTPTYLGALTGGGAVVAPVFCNGTAWVSD